MNDLSKAAKALILTWIMIGLFIAGAVGFYFGRTTAPKSQSQDATGVGGQQPIGGKQSPQGATPSAAPSNSGPGGQQPAGQPPPQR